MKLIFLSGSEKDSIRNLPSGEVKIGRETDNDIQLLVGGVSRYHAKISAVQKDGTRLITDLGSTNGTKVNGVNIDGPAVLKNDDLILIGDQLMRVVAEKSASSRIIIRSADTENENASVTEKENKNKKVFSVKEPEKNDLSGTKQEKKKDHVVFNNPDQGVLGDIFGESDSSYNTEEGEYTFMKERKKKGKFSSLLFYVLLVCAAVLCICIFLKLYVMPEPQKNNVAVQKKDPNKFFLVYEKEESTNTSVFRFEMLLECVRIKKETGKYEETAMVSYAVSEQKADENISYRIVQEPVAIEMKDVDKLRKGIQDTEFMKLKKEESDMEVSRSEKDKYTRITVGYNGNLNAVTVRNTSPRISFSSVQELIENFTDEVLGVRTVSMSVTEIQTQAEKYYNLAREYFENYEAKPRNLSSAIRHYKLAIELLSRFRPRPKMCIEAQKDLEKAEEIYARLKKETLNDLKIKLKLNELPEALVKAKLLLEYLDPASPGYEKIRNVKISIERQMQMGNNKKRRR